MEHVIDWRLYNNKKLLIHRKNINVEYIFNDKIIYKTNDEYNEIDIRNKLYIRKTNEVNMEIDFNKNICKFDFADQGCCKIDIKSNFLINDDELKMIYIIDEEEKIVVINLKNSVFN